MEGGGGGMRAHCDHAAALYRLSGNTKAGSSLTNEHLVYAAGSQENIDSHAIHFHNLPVPCST